VQDDPALARGVNVLRGSVVLAEVAQAHARDYLPLAEALG
jgi:alanine dehydrogenase